MKSTLLTMIALALTASFTFFSTPSFSDEGEMQENFSKLDSADRETLANANDGDEFDIIIRLRQRPDAALLEDLSEMGLRIDSRIGVILSARGSKATITALLALDVVRRVELSRVIERDCH